MSTKTGKLPRIRVDDPGLQRYLDSIANTMELREGERGNKEDAFITWRDLEKAGAIRRRTTGGGSVPYEPDFPEQEGLPNYSVPPPLTGVEVGAAVQNVILTWEYPGNWMGNFGAVNVYRGELDDFGQAIKIGESGGTTYLDPVGPGQAYYYWLTITNEQGIEGPTHQTAGVLAETGVDVGHLLGQLEDEITESQLYADLNSRIDLIDDNETGLVTRTETLETETSAQATEISQLTATVDDNTAAIETKAEVTALQDVEDDVAPLSAQWTVKTDVNDLVSGIGLYNDGQQTVFAVNANRFYITDDGTVPFVVDDGQTFIRDAMIQDAAITTAKIQDGFLDNLTADKGTLAQARIGKGDIFNLTIDDRIQSGNFTTGSLGWRVLKDGTAEFNDATFRGHVEMESGQINEAVTIGGLGDFAYKDSVFYNEVAGTKPPSDADKTGDNTSYDTARVAGTGASTVRDRANNGNNAYDRVYNSWTRPNSTLIDGNKIFTGDAYVDTLQIKGQAVTFTAASEGADGDFDAYDSYHDLDLGTYKEFSVATVSTSRTENTPAAVIIYVTTRLHNTSDDDGSWLAISARIRAGSNTILDWVEFGLKDEGVREEAFSTFRVTIPVLDTANRSGSVTYRLDLMADPGPNGSWRVYYSRPYISVLETKR